MNKFLLTTAVALLASSTAVRAADFLPPVVDVMSTSSYDWSGFYAGVLGTYGSIDGWHNDIGYWDSGATVIQNYAGYGIGATVGFNNQVGALVYGVEGDISWLNGSRTTERYYGDFTTSIDALATLRARVGAALDGTLLYGTAGLAAANLSYSFVDDEDSDVFFSEEGWNFGFAVGAGVEQAVSSNVTLKAEYLYTSIGSGQTTFEEDDEYPVDLGTNAHLFRLGANFAF